eukprot:COSAG06_NODE_1639_length_8832_cov_33.453515_5_plen_360_part_00
MIDIRHKRGGSIEFSQQADATRQHAQPGRWTLGKGSVHPLLSRRFPTSMSASILLLDGADKALSAPVFRLQLPWAAELALTVPGQWCGMPASALSLFPVLIAAMATRSRALALGAGAGAAGIGALWFTLLLQRGVRDGTDKLVGSALGLLVVPFCTLGFLARVGGADSAAVPAGAFVCTCYLTLQFTVALIKWATLRRRPLHCPSLALSSVHRHFQLAADCEHVGKGMGRYESFPSGDAGSAALFGTAMCLLCPADAWAASGGRAVASATWALALSVAFGRMYFHAHHLGDCVFGAAFGHVIPQLLDGALPWQEFKWWHMAIALLVYLSAQIVARSPTARPGLGLTIREREQRTRSAAD